MMNNISLVYIAAGISIINFLMFAKLILWDIKSLKVMLRIIEVSLKGQMEFFTQVEKLSKDNQTNKNIEKDNNKNAKNN